MCVSTFSLFNFEMVISTTCDRFLFLTFVFCFQIDFIGTMRCLYHAVSFTFERELFFLLYIYQTSVVTLQIYILYLKFVKYYLLL